jgi:hypothetical protein
MQTTIKYEVPDNMLDGILAQLGYSEELGSKEIFMNEAITKVVLPAIADVFINTKQIELAKIAQSMPGEVHALVEQMLSITTV